MKSSKLTEARSYETKYKEQISPRERPLFHVTPAVGWLNDPNGFSVYKGEYHLFYQYHPYDINWGPMHWGHVKSTDLIRWERLPASLAPDQEYDGQGCFSGSAAQTPDGRHLIMYTGVQGKDNSPECRQTQCMAYGDGVDYVKYENNPVISADMLPKGCSASDFRDPKLWWDKEEGCYYAVAGNRTEDGSGAVLLFTSRDGFQWSYVSMLDRSENRHGRMWECPDMFELGGKGVMLVSPQEMRAEGLTFHNGNDVICLIGSYDKAAHSFTREATVAVDYGLDFYAPQTVEAPDGRRIMIAWMQSWESSHFHPHGTKWAGMLTLPREVSLADGHLIQTPVRELLSCRVSPVVHKGIRLEGRTELPGVKGRVLDMTAEFRVPDGEEPPRSAAIHIAENESYRTTITFDPSENTVCLDRTDSGYRYNIVSSRKAPVRDQGGRLKLRIVLDRFSVEVFINDGEQVMSACLYTPQEADGITFESDGAVLLDVEKYELALEHV